MQTRQKSAFRAFRAVLGFIDSVPKAAESLSGSGARTKLAAVVGRLEELAVTQDPSRAHRVGMTKKLAKARRTLRLSHMRPIAKVAAASLKTKEELANLKTAHVNMDTEALVTAAFSMAKAAEPHAATFVEAGLPADFVDRLRAAAVAVRQVVDEQVQMRGLRVAATTGLSEQVKIGAQALSILDAIVTPELEKESDEVLKRWREAKRVAQRVASDGASAVPASELKDPVEATPAAA
jgi:hypothetical protein